MFTRISGEDGVSWSNLTDVRDIFPSWVGEFNHQLSLCVDLLLCPSSGPVVHPKNPGFSPTKIRNGLVGFSWEVRPWVRPLDETPCWKGWWKNQANHLVFWGGVGKGLSSKKRSTSYFDKNGWRFTTTSRVCIQPTTIQKSWETQTDTNELKKG